MSEKKVVRRSVAIALGIVCILLIAGIGGTTAYYTMVINDKNTTYDNYASSHSHTNSEFNTLNQTYQDYLGTHTHTNSEYDNYVGNHSHTNSEYNDYVSTHNHTNAEYNNYVDNHSYTNDQYESYVNDHSYTNEQYTDLNDMVNLAKSMVWVDDQTVSQPANSYTSWVFSTCYAGYVEVWVQTSTTTNTRVRVIYSSHGVDYDGEIGVGSSGTAVFPLLPSSNIEIRVGNHNLVSGATETVTITYHY
jgi:hypothetical protein